MSAALPYQNTNRRQESNDLTIIVLLYSPPFFILFLYIRLRPSMAITHQSDWEMIFTSEPDLKVPSRPLEPLVQTKLRILCLKHSKRIKSFEISSSLALGSISDASLDNGRVVTRTVQLFCTLYVEQNFGESPYGIRVTTHHQVSEAYIVRRRNLASWYM
uniref:Uncharacterized protein n=1 Tax=Glossina pallidipes TaxID=7398 RepID=A0A1A9ZWM2_GLOPL